ncbi:DnaD domain-containing protein [Cohnella nanjingensis]|uniref:DnaD domain-containing protein n=1 Tax=Cohnella nanjingensis TaxID=1387779 RepID=A0A7X0RUT7_9BACL|nr:DnaD domain-containing protein [Cohnella nanjingensis]MBB6674084.1 DnaD domain-containing protein [Cohnella nanjingensis]
MSELGGVAKGLAEAYLDGAVSVPYALLRSYRALKLTDTDCMLLLQLLAFRQLEQNDFPTMEQLQERLGAGAATIGQTLQNLMRMGLVNIDEVTDPVSGVRAERYNLSGLFHRIGTLLAGGELPLRAGPADASAPKDASRPVVVRAHVTLFGTFEQEFGRPLTPMEIETINGWLDQDRYPEELVLFALKESVFAGKLHFRYIDRILLEWSRNRVQSVEDARAHAQRFRVGR